MRAGRLALTVESRNFQNSERSNRLCESQGSRSPCRSSGTAIEVPLKTQLQLDVIKKRTISWPQFENDDAIMTVGAYRPLDDAVRIAFTELVHWIHN
jgi:amidase